MPVIRGTRGVLDRLFSAAGAPRTLFAPGDINGTAQASDVVTIGRNGTADAIWSLDQWDGGRSSTTEPGADPYLEVHGFEPEHDRLIIRSGRGSWYFHAVETDVDGDGREDVVLGKYDYDRHGGGSGPGLQGFIDKFAVLDGVTAAELGLPLFAGGRFGEIYWISDMSGPYPGFLQTSAWDPLANEYAATSVPGADLVPIPLPPGSITPIPLPPGSIVPIPLPPGTITPIPLPPTGINPIPAPGGGSSGGTGGGVGVPADELVPLPPLDSSQRLTDAVSRRDPITSRSRRPNKLTGTDGLDLLQPWRGRDTVTGLGGADAVLLAKRAEFGKRHRDVIADFEPGLDRLFITHRFADYGSTFRFHSTGPELTLKQGQRLAKGFIYDSGIGGLWFNENGRRPGWGDGGLALQFLGAPPLTNDDWIVS